MTFNEGWIEVRAGGAHEPLDSAISSLPIFGKLEARPGRADYWVPHVQAWAQSRSKEIHYIDNCWLKVAVSANELREFLSALPDPGATWAQNLAGRIDQADSYLIEAEEF